MIVKNDYLGHGWQSSLFKEFIMGIADMMIPGYNPEKAQQNNHPEGWPITFDKPVVGIERKGVFTDNWNAPLFGALEAIKNIRLKGHKLMIIADETGRLESDVNQENQKLMKTFGDAGIHSIDGHLYSINTDTKDPFVKPNNGMFKRATEMDPSVKWSQGYYVGSTIIDMKTAIKIKAKPIFVNTSEHEFKKLFSHAHKPLLKQVTVVESLLEFAASL